MLLNVGGHNVVAWLI